MIAAHREVALFIHYPAGPGTVGTIHLPAAKRFDFAAMLFMLTHEQHGVAGFSCFQQRRDPANRYLGVFFPTWMAILLSGVLPVAWLYSPRRRRARRSKLGLCQSCGYDLRASADRCPECGAMIDHRSAKSHAVLRAESTETPRAQRGSR
jgi:predicted RNA-binding Zn-ribbon protein involved in translation (DUF1610 family)